MHSSLSPLSTGWFRLLCLLSCSLASFSSLRAEFDPALMKAMEKADIFDFIEAYYNTHRKHSHLGYLTPAKFEAEQDTIN